MNLEGKVKEIIAEQLGISEDEISSDSSFVEDLGVDSLDMVELVMALEEEFEIEVMDDDAEKFEKVGDLLGYLSNRIG